MDEIAAFFIELIDATDLVQGAVEVGSLVLSPLTSLFTGSNRNDSALLDQLEAERRKGHRKHSF